MIDKTSMKTINQNKNIVNIHSFIGSPKAGTKEDICDDVGKRLMNLHPLREGGNHQRIEEVSSECET